MLSSTPKFEECSRSVIWHFKYSFRNRKHFKSLQCTSKTIHNILLNIYSYRRISLNIYFTYIVSLYVTFKSALQVRFLICFNLFTFSQYFKKRTKKKRVYLLLKYKTLKFHFRANKEMFLQVQHIELIKIDDGKCFRNKFF